MRWVGGCRGDGESVGEEAGREGVAWLWTADDVDDDFTGKRTERLSVGLCAGTLAGPCGRVCALRHLLVEPADVRGQTPCIIVSHPKSVGVTSCASTARVWEQGAIRRCDA